MYSLIFDGRGVGGMNAAVRDGAVTHGGCDFVPSAAGLGFITGGGRITVPEPGAGDALACDDEPPC